MRQFWIIVHFQVASSLCFKARPSSKPLIWKCFYSHANKTHFNNKNFHLASFWKWGFFKLGNGLLNYLAVEEKLSACCSFEKKYSFHFNFPHFFPVWTTASFKTFSRIPDSVQTLTFGSKLREASNCSYLENISYDIYLFYFRGYLLFQPGKEREV